MTWKTTLLLGALLVPALAISAPTSADDCSKSTLAHLNGLRPSYGDCIDKAGSNTAAMQACIDTEFTYQDKRLNAAYGALMRKLTPAQQAKLKAEERRWMQFRDDRCADVVDGLDMPELDAASCRVDETGRQATLLEARAFVK